MKYCIPIRLPSLNEYLKACNKNRYAGGKFKKDVESEIAYFLHGKVEKPVHITFVWHEPNRRRDKDNVFSAKKFILDAMQKKGVLPNDNNQWVLGIKDEIVYGGEGVDVILEECQK